MSTYAEQLGQFLINVLTPVPPESQLEVTLELIQALSHHLGMLANTVQQSGRLSPDEIGQVYRDIHTAVTPPW